MRLTAARLRMLGLATGTVALLAACYENAPRSGPLARIADSLAPQGALQRCVTPSLRLPAQARHRDCRYQGTDTVLVDVGATGRVFSVVKLLASDPQTLSLFDSSGGQWVKLFGRPDYAGTDTHGGLEFHWRSDTLCVSLYRPRNDRDLQLSYVLPEYLGRCP